MTSQKVRIVITAEVEIDDVHGFNADHLHTETTHDGEDYPVIPSGLYDAGLLVSNKLVQLITPEAAQIDGVRMCSVASSGAWLPNADGSYPAFTLPALPAI